MRVKDLAWVGVGVAAIVTLFGCGSEFSETCDKAIACMGGNDKEKNACVADAEGEKSAAEAYDCGDAFKTYSDCEKNSGSCQNGAWTSGTACSAAKKSLDLCKCMASYRGAQGKCS
jgi:hypothetical protein